MSESVTQFTEVVYDPFRTDKGFKNELNQARFRVSEGDKLCLRWDNVASDAKRAGDNDISSQVSAGSELAVLHAMAVCMGV